MQFEETAIKRGSGWKTIKGTEVMQSNIDKISPKGLVHKLETKQTKWGHLAEMNTLWSYMIVRY